MGAAHSIVLLFGQVSSGGAVSTTCTTAAQVPTLPLTLPVRVQILRNLTPTCWEATFSTSSRNDAAVFTAKSDP